MLGLISINYKIAPVNIRELFYIYPDDFQKIFNEINDRITLKGLYIISTCNRTELYFETTKNKTVHNKIFHSVIMSLSKLKRFNDGLRPYIKKKEGAYNISEHLF